MQGVLSFYYKNDLEVKQDSELQKWIQDIYQHGFLSQKDTGELNAAVSHTIFNFSFIWNKECAFCPILTGIPQSFTTVAEMVKFVTMVVFTCSAQHSAVNGGQVTFYKAFGFSLHANSSLTDTDQRQSCCATAVFFFVNCFCRNVTTTRRNPLQCWNISLSAKEIRKRNLSQLPLTPVIVWLRRLDAQQSHHSATSPSDHKGDHERGHDAENPAWCQRNGPGDGYHVAAEQAVHRLCKSI